MPDSDAGIVVRVRGDGAIEFQRDRPLRFRAESGMFEVQVGEGPAQTTTSTSFTELPQVITWADLLAPLDIVIAEAEAKDTQRARQVAEHGKRFRERLRNAASVVRDASALKGVVDAVVELLRSVL